MSKLRSIISAFRPKTLSAALVPCVAGTALCQFEGGRPQYLIFFLALLSAVCIQIGTNLVNDAMDFKKGADTSERIGPARITQQGVLLAHQVLWIATGFFILAILLGVPLVVRGGWPIVVVGVLSVLMGYAYTSGPYPLAYVGLGDLFVVLFFGIIAVMGMHYLHWGTLDKGISWSGFVLGLQVGFLATILIAINNLRDVWQDRLAHKKTLAVRFGEKFVRIEVLALVLATFVLQIYWLYRGGKWAFWLPLLSLPLAMVLIKNIWSHKTGQKFNIFLGQAALLQVFFGSLMALGLFLSAQPYLLSE